MPDAPPILGVAHCWSCAPRPGTKPCTCPTDGAGHWLSYECPRHATLECAKWEDTGEIMPDDPRTIAPALTPEEWRALLAGGRVARAVTGDDWPALGLEIRSPDSRDPRPMLSIDNNEIEDLSTHRVPDSIFAALTYLTHLSPEAHHDSE